MRKDEDIGNVLLTGRLPNVVKDIEAVRGGCSCTIVVVVVAMTLTFSSLINSTLSLLDLVVLTSARTDSVTISSEGLEMSSLGT